MAEHDDDYDNYQRKPNEDFEQRLSSSLSKRELSDDYSLLLFLTVFGVDDDLQDQLTEIVNGLSEEERKPIVDIISGNMALALQSLCLQVIDEGKSILVEDLMEMAKMIFDMEFKQATKKFNTNDRNVFSKVFEQMNSNAAKACRILSKMSPK
ncbi:unnamed protein product, partial [Didymodactylos carnosus]